MHENFVLQLCSLGLSVISYGCWVFVLLLRLTVACICFGLALYWRFCFDFAGHEKTTLEVEMSKCYTKRSFYYLCALTLYCSQPSQLNLSFSSLHFCIEMVWVIATELHTCMYKREYIWVLLAFCLQFSLNIFLWIFTAGNVCACVDFV